MPVASKSEEVVETSTPRLPFEKDVLWRVCVRPCPSKMCAKRSPALAEEKANTTGKPRESHRALISRESMLTTVAVRLFALAMYENVRATAPGEAARLAPGAASAASAPNDRISAT